MQKHLFVFLLSLFAVFADAQEFKHRQFTTSNGLSSTTIYHALQDRNGYLWLATDAGVTRFDGTHFKQYYKDDGLGDNDIIHLLLGRGGEVGFLSYNGVFSFYKNEKIYNPTNHEYLKNASFGTALYSGFQDSKGNVWLGCKSGEVFQLNSRGVTSYGQKPVEKIAKNAKNSGKASPVSFFHESSDGSIWADGIYKIEYRHLRKGRFAYEFIGGNAFFTSPEKRNEVLFLSEDGIVRMTDTVQELVPTSYLTKKPAVKHFGYLHEDRDGNIWLPTIGDGVYCYRAAYSSALPDHYLEGQKVSTVLEDHEGNHWFSLLGEGLYMLPANYENTLGYNLGRVNAVTTTPDRTAWLGLDDAKILLVDLQSQKTELNIPLPSGIDRADQNVLHIHCDNQHRIWAMTPNTITVFTRKKEKYLPQTVLTERRYTYKNWSFGDDGSIAIAHSKGVIRSYRKGALSHKKDGQWLYSAEIPRFSEVDTFKNKITYSVFLDKKHSLWVGNIEGLFEQTVSKRLIRYSNYYEEFGEKIKSMALLADNQTMVLAAEGFGLFFLNDKHLIGRLSRYDSLPDNVCRRVFVSDSIVWCTGNHGLTRIRFKNGKYAQILTYKSADGLLSDEINDVFVAGEEVFVATSKGLNILRGNLQGVAIAPPHVYIENKLFEAKRQPDTLATPPFYPDSRFQINYDAVAYREPEAVEYRYRLRERDQWLATKNTTQAFSQLTAGNYRFEVQARHLGSRWSDSDFLEFTIYPFWYQTWWMTFLMLIALGGSAFFAASRLAKRQQDKETQQLQAEKRMIELEQQALQSMMNPHFIFNVMNSVQYFLNHNEKEAANRYLSQFAKMLRTNLEYSNKPFIPLEDELAYLKLYLSLEKLRCGDKMHYEFVVEDDLDTEYIQLPPMLLQPYVENAIWHGIMPAEAGGKITICISEIENDILCIKIIDNGIGIDNSKAAKAENPSNHHSLALTLTNDRLRIMQQITHRIYQVSIAQIAPEGGTEVTMLLSV
jgi:ligand-binding sensor domain-containing protein